MASFGERMKERYGHMPRLGWEEVKAFWRQGLAEARAMLFPESNIAQPPDPAMPGVISHGEAADVRRGIDRSMSGRERASESVLGKYESGRDANRDEGPSREDRNREDRNRQERDLSPERE